MKKKKNLTLKRVLKNHKENPQDKDLHNIIETGKVEKKEFDKIVNKAGEQEAFDRKGKL